MPITPIMTANIPSNSKPSIMLPPHLMNKVFSSLIAAPSQNIFLVGGEDSDPAASAQQS